MTAKAHPKNALSATFVSKTRQSGRYTDGHGLYLVIEPSGSRRWEQRLQIRGKRRTLGLGGFPVVSLGTGTGGGAGEQTQSARRTRSARREARRERTGTDEGEYFRRREAGRCGRHPIERVAVPRALRRAGRRRRHPGRGRRRRSRLPCLPARRRGRWCPARALRAAWRRRRGHPADERERERVPPDGPGVGPMSRRTEQRDVRLARAAFRLAGGSRVMTDSRLRLQADDAGESRHVCRDGDPARAGYVARRRRVAASLDLPESGR